MPAVLPTCGSSWLIKFMGMLDIFAFSPSVGAT